MKNVYTNVEDRNFLVRSPEGTMRIQTISATKQIIPTLGNLLQRLRKDDIGIKCKTTTLWKTIKIILFYFKNVN